jgi:hypothetical protein
MGEDVPFLDLNVKEGILDKIKNFFTKGKV